MHCISKYISATIMNIIIGATNITPIVLIHPLSKKSPITNKIKPIKAQQMHNPNTANVIFIII